MPIYPCTEQTHLIDNCIIQINSRLPRHSYDQSGSVSVNSCLSPASRRQKPETAVIRSTHLMVPTVNRHTEPMFCDSLHIDTPKIYDT